MCEQLTVGSPIPSDAFAKLDVSKLDGMKITVDEDPSADGSVAHLRVSKSQYLLTEARLISVFSMALFSPIFRSL